MITLTGLHKSFGQQKLLEGASLQINRGDRFALVGPNGAGKSTLFKILLGTEEADGGELNVKRGSVIGYLPQENAPVSKETVLATALEDSPDADGRLIARAKALLMGLGFRVADFERPLDTLSGGWAMRVALAKLLLREPDLLLLDEPTNHLDIDSLFWFQTFLDSYQGAVFVISHDRAFINHVCRAVVALEDHQLKVYHGDYEHYLREKEAAKDRVVQVWKQQQEEIEAMEDFIARNRARHATAGRAQSMIKRLERLERIRLPQEAKTVKIRFPQPPRAGVRVLQLKNVSKAYGSVQVYKDLDFELERGMKMAFVGHNGAGKSTLLKCLAGVLPVDSGERVVAEGVNVGYFSQHREGQLDPDKTVLQQALMANRGNPELLVRTILGTFLFPGDTVYKKAGVLSGGEKSRLQLVKLLLDPPNVMLMDEPTTHLDMPSVDALLAALKEFEGTICCISHDLYFVNALADHILHIDRGAVTLYPGDYDYFKRRQAQWREENPQAVEVPVAEKPHGKPSPPPRPADPRKLAKRLAKLEEELFALHLRLEELAGLLSDPVLYADYAKVQAVGEEMEQVQQAIQEKEAEAARLR